MSKSKVNSQSALEVFKQLATLFSKQNYSLYLVGGSVRDLFLNRAIHDLDLTTDAHPEVVYELLLSAGKIPNDVGMDYGTVGFEFDGYVCEITTMRIEGNYEDGRHPIDVFFTTDLNKDLSRRDFTMNAMALSLDGQIIDPMDGQKDIEKALLRAVGEAEIRLIEDGIRFLRAIRMKTTFKLTYDSQLEMAMKNQVGQLRRLPIERVRQEIEKGFKEDEGLSTILELLHWNCIQTLHPTLFTCKDSYNKEYDFEKELKWVKEANLYQGWTHTTIKNRCELGWILLGYVVKNHVEVESFYKGYGLSNKRIKAWINLHKTLESLNQLSRDEWHALGHTRGTSVKNTRLYWLKILSETPNKDRSLLVDMILLSASTKVNEAVVKALKQRLNDLCYGYPMDWQSMPIDPDEMETLRGDQTNMKGYGEAIKELKMHKQEEVWKKDMEKEIIETYNRKGTTGK